MKSVFEFKNYKLFIQSQIRANQQIRGYQGRLATASRCEPSFLSKVLRGDQHLGLEHAANMARYWELDPEEQSYFVDLVALARAGSATLREILVRRLGEQVAARSNIEKRLSLPELGESELAAYYYSTWHVAAIHVLLSIPGFQAVPAISDRLGIPQSRVEETLVLLQKHGLVQRNSRGWCVGRSMIHLPRNSPWIAAHHTSWRVQGLKAAQRIDADSLHFSGIFSLGRDDLALIKEDLARTIKQCSIRIQESPAERLMVLNVDCFEPQGL